MRCRRLIALGAFRTEEPLCGARRREIEQCIRSLAGGLVGSLGLRGLEVIRELDRGPRISVLEVLGCQGRVFNKAGRRRRRILYLSGQRC